MTERITKREMFTEVLDIINSTDVENKGIYLDFINHEIELLKKKSTSRKPTAQQKENEVLIKTILSVLEASSSIGNDFLTIAEIQCKSPTLNEYNGKPISNQRISALLKKLIESGQVEREEFKRKAYFKIVK